MSDLIHQFGSPELALAAYNAGPAPVEACSPSQHVGTPPQALKHVVAYDFGMKRNILRRLAQVGCRLTVVPARTSAEDVLARADRSTRVSRR